MEKNAINVISRNLLMKQIKYYYKIEMGKKEKNIIRPLLKVQRRKCNNLTSSTA